MKFLFSDGNDVQAVILVLITLLIALAISTGTAVLLLLTMPLAMLLFWKCLWGSLALVLNLVAILSAGYYETGMMATLGVVALVAGIGDLITGWQRWRANPEPA